MDRVNPCGHAMRSPHCRRGLDNLRAVGVTTTDVFTGDAAGSRSTSFSRTPALGCCSRACEGTGTGGSAPRALVPQRRDHALLSAGLRSHWMEVGTQEGARGEEPWHVAWRASDRP